MAEKEDKRSTCGIVMPISALESYSESHWSDVLAILTDAIDEAGFEANLVSNADEVGIIQKRIIQNLYDNPIVVCDVSGKNPNVMFELGMRLAFDKPTIIVKDDATTYSFDTSPIEHLSYPRDLRFGRIVDFKAKLAEKIAKTHEKAINDDSYTTFLKNFGEFKVAKIEKKEVSSQEFILEELRGMRHVISKIESQRRLLVPEPAYSPTITLSRKVNNLPHDKMIEIGTRIRRIPGVEAVSWQREGDDSQSLHVVYNDPSRIDFINVIVDEYSAKFAPQFPPVRYSRKPKVEPKSEGDNTSE